MTEKPSGPDVKAALASRIQDAPAYRSKGSLSSGSEISAVVLCEPASGPGGTSFIRYDRHMVEVNRDAAWISTWKLAAVLERRNSRRDKCMNWTLVSGFGPISIRFPQIRRSFSAKSGR